jgi:hypothetical protein
VVASTPSGLKATAQALVSIASLPASQAAVNAIQSTLDARLDATVSSRASEASVSQINTRLTSIEAGLGTLATQAALATIGSVVQLGLDAPVSSRASSTELAAVSGKVDALQAALPSTSSLSAITAAVSALGTSLRESQTRIAIEQALARAEMVASFYLPTANGGQLDLVRTVVGDVVDKSEAAGGNATNVARARKLLSDGDARKAAGDYRGAYLLYAGGYQVLGMMAK